MLAKQARRVLNLLDDTPTVPGEERQPFEGSSEAQHILNDAETSLRGWSASHEPIHMSSTGMGSNAMPGSGSTAGESIESPSSTTTATARRMMEERERAQEEGREEAVVAPSTA